MGEGERTTAGARLKEESLACIEACAQRPEEAAVLIERFPWARWRPGVRATLVFIQREDEVLLIEKKTGLGAGKVNGPGGKLEPGESPLECARREVAEELSLSVEALTPMAQLRFLMSTHPDIECVVFVTEHFTGTPTESREAKPLWVSIEEIPWARMWADDVLWLPRILKGERLSASFAFRGETLCAERIESVEESTLDARAEQHW